VRRFTLITIIVLCLLIVGAAISQLILAGSDRPRFPGPVPGTPFPSPSTTIANG
jgi:hypothetical protein